MDSFPQTITKYFVMPINDAAKEMGICSTLLKKRCRQHNIQRWPYRKIRTIRRLMKMNPDNLHLMLAYQKLLANPNISLNHVISKSKRTRLTKQSLPAYTDIYPKKSDILSILASLCCQELEKAKDMDDIDVLM